MICFCTASPRSWRVSGLVVDWPGSGSWTPRPVRTSLVTCRKSKTSTSSGSVRASVET
ncbi:hypothetical protein ACFFOQ_13320 [Planobispora takensis]